MSLIALLAVIVVVGVLAWAATSFIPMPPVFARLVVGVAVIVVLLVILDAFGVIDLLTRVRVPRTR